MRERVLTQHPEGAIRVPRRQGMARQAAVLP
jgi:hypothetical protein